MTKTNLKSIETKYKGYRFRSRLEARWAVFFDALNFKWEYEPEGFDLGFGELYLPDFRVTSPQGHVTWYEVKPENHEGESPKLMALKVRYEQGREMDYDGTEFVTLAGDPVAVLCAGFQLYVCPCCGVIGEHGMGHYGTSCRAVPVYCTVCDFAGRYSTDDAVVSPALSEPLIFHKGYLEFANRASYNRYADRIVAAASAARGARFEHGESGGLR